MTNNDSQFSVDHVAWGGKRSEHGGESLVLSFNQQPTNVVGPNFDIPDYPVRFSGASEPQGSDVHPPLFGQDRTKGGFGPVYAVPAFPFPHGQNSPIQTMPQPTWQQSQWGNQPQHGGYFVPMYCPVHWPQFNPQGNE